VIFKHLTRKKTVRGRHSQRETVLLPGTKTLISFELRRSTRARNLRLEIHSESGLRVVLPQNLSVQKARDFIIAKERWILKHLKDRPVQKHLSDGDSVLYRGKALQIRALAISDTSAIVRLHEPFFEVRLPKTTDLSLNRILEAWFRQQAKTQISREVRHLARELNVAVGRIFIRDQKTRWASCSSKGNLNFNWRLLMAPPEVLRYVIIHELTHREQMNHSRKFWALVAKRCPDYKNHQKWLKENGAKLREV